MKEEKEFKCNCDCCKGGECTCGDDCKCGEDCTCDCCKKAE